ncbi:hypothetical protein AVEN_205701-1 [Araneus ventricosus]|uniref:Integrase catalytic domain-containing protein n=1 Tax=Araneus ventricosus TaxID=182803 RepID=A0A4Y2QW13_ARAVE|nr:hypothetical protein AVEN_205701-1 [Araneus ventricosus]
MHSPLALWCCPVYTPLDWILIIMSSKQGQIQNQNFTIDADPTEFRLKTVTYGTTSAPFLAIRTLKQLALDESSRFPLASDVTQQYAYMDDIVSGASDLGTTKELQSQLHSMLKAGGMTLHKWRSNSKELWNSCASNDQEHQFLSTTEPSVKTLGITWKPTKDNFTFKMSIIEMASCTKRDVLSVIARLYDPLGFIGPVITKAKMFLQKLWQLKFIEELHIDRFLLADAIKKTILVGFADASQAAYGAVVYMKSISETNSVVMKLIASKSRIAPIKTISIPRLELSACLLLSQLVEKIIDALKMKIDDVILHTDSTIALAWINTPPNQLQTFIGNRVSKIQDLTESCKWRHISSHLNTADIISRGTNSLELAKLTLWWRGPQMSQDDSLEIPVQNIDVSSDKLYLSELKNLTNCSLISTVDSSFLDNLLNVSNNFCKLIRIVAFIFRFFNNLRSTSRCLGPLTLKELQLTKLTLVKLVQLTCFRVEIKSLEKGEIVTKGQVSCLNPFLDESKILRVGGRFNNADLSFDKKFPILLPKNNKFTLLVMQYFHLKYLHVGAQTLLYLVRQEFWPLSGRNAARKIIHDCVICAKNKPRIVTQIMGNLPTNRVNPSYPFSHVGIDFCGPFYIKYKGQKKGIYQKCYVAVFICFATKAIHLETVTDLTADAMIATLKRFFSRRGTSSSICTDNATNFKGANSDLKRL